MHDTAESGPYPKDLPDTRRPVCPCYSEGADILYRIPILRARAVVVFTKQYM